MIASYHDDGYSDNYCYKNTQTKVMVLSKNVEMLHLFGWQITFLSYK